MPLIDPVAFVFDLRREAMEAPFGQRNGLDLELLQGEVDEIRDVPEAGRVTIRTRHVWDGGFAVIGYAEEVVQAGETLPRSFTFRTDWPAEAGGKDSGPAPGEAILGALGGCVGMTYVLKAAMRGVDIEALEITMEGDVDLRGAFELDDDVRPGLSNVGVTVKVRSGGDDETLEELARTVTRTSAVLDSLAHSVPVELRVQRLP